MVSGPTPEKATAGLPDRWLHCPNVGTLIMDRFLPFKTPLCALYDNQIPDKNQRFHPKDVFTHPHLQGKRIGLWVDLTKTDRYYFREDVTETGCTYKKLALAGHGQSPTEEETSDFVRMVSTHLQGDPDAVVAVHCTHGFNRTGFLIAAYLFNIDGWGIDAAITEFALNRPLGIYKQDYVNDLFKRYGEDEEPILAPPRPNWDDPTGSYSNGSSYEAMEYASGASTSSYPQQQQQQQHQNDSGGGSSSSAVNCKQFMDGQVPGVKICEDEGKKSQLRGKIKKLCQYNRDGFPGLQPVSLSRQNLDLMAKEPYQVSWKADGMRYMVYIMDRKEIYAFDRDNEVFEFGQLDFPARKGGHIKNTLVDAEMIIDEVREADGTLTKVPRLLIYDVIHYETFNLMKENFITRTDCIKKELIGPRTLAFSKNEIRREEQIMSVRAKDFYDISCVSKLLHKDFTGKVGHEIDGLIFQPIKMPYVPGRCDAVLKWKPPSHNSVDFLLKVEKVKKEGMLPEWKGLLYVQHQKEPFGTMKATNTLKKYDNKIIECRLEVDSHGRPREWIFMRERTDKSAPNAIRTAQNVLETMTNPVTEDILINFVADVVRHQQKYQQQRLHQQQQRHPNEPQDKRQRHE